MVAGLVEIVLPLSAEIVVAGASQRSLVHLDTSEFGLVGLVGQIVHLRLGDRHASLLADCDCHFQCGEGIPKCQTPHTAVVSQPATAILRPCRCVYEEEATHRPTVKLFSGVSRRTARVDHCSKGRPVGWAESFRLADRLAESAQPVKEDGARLDAVASVESRLGAGLATPQAPREASDAGRCMVGFRHPWGG